ncbi:MAG: nuclear transport factor 2 family protein [Gammaproteobacteria bacterium]
MITMDFARNFAEQWVEAWNSHDLSAVLAHYSDNFEMSSPYIVQIASDPSGTLKGKELVAAYWSAALERMPTLNFELLQVLVGVESVTIYYRGVRGLVAEVFFFNANGLVVKACAHYE